MELRSNVVEAWVDEYAWLWGPTAFYLETEVSNCYSHKNFLNLSSLIGGPGLHRKVGKRRQRLHLLIRYVQKE
jgi:hypothetical protein